MKNPVLKETLTTRDVADLISMDVSTVIDWINKNKMPAYRTVGGHRRIHRDDLLAFLEKNEMPVPEDLSIPKRTVLIVEDDAVQRRLLKRLFLQNWPDFRIEEAADGFKAGIKVEKFKPDLVILDVYLPGVDGYQVCKMIRGEAGFSRTRILAVSGSNIGETEIRIRRAGADAFLGKPFTPPLLKAKVEILINPALKYGVQGIPLVRAGA